MYAFFSILAICATILVLFWDRTPSFRIIHEYHQHVGDNSEISVDDLEDYERNKETLDDALHKVQSAMNIVNGGGIEDDE